MVPLAHRVHAEGSHRAGRRRKHAREQLDRRALASAVWTRIGHDLAAPYRHAHVPQRMDLPDLRAQEIAPGVAKLLRTLFLMKDLRYAHELNCDVRSRGSDWSLSAHSA